MKEGTKRLVTGCLWSAVAGAVIWWIVGFSLFGWTLGSTAKRDAAEAETKARAEVRTLWCLERAKAPTEAKKIVELKAVQDSYGQTDAVVAAGWATFPGSPEANRDVAEACAVALLKPAGKQATGK